MAAITPKIGDSIKEIREFRDAETGGVINENETKRGECCPVVVVPYSFISVFHNLKIVNRKNYKELVQRLKVRS